MYIHIYIYVYMPVCVYKKSINLFWGVCFSATHSFADEIWVFVNNNQNWTGVPWHGFSGYIDVYRIYLPYFLKNGETCHKPSQTMIHHDSSKFTVWFKMVLSKTQRHHTISHFYSSHVKNLWGLPLFAGEGHFPVAILLVVQDFFYPPYLSARRQIISYYELKIVEVDFLANTADCFVVDFVHITVIII